MSQNALSQSDCSTFESIISPKQNEEIARFFAFWSKFMKIKNRKFFRGVWSKLGMTFKVMGL